MTDYGIDISSWQGTAIDWPAVRGHNISFASVKVTESTNYVNPAASAQVDGARSVGIAVGGYHYAQPGNVGGQVDHFVNQLNARGLLNSGSLWPMLDMEAPEFVGDPNGFVAEFIRLFRERTGRPLLVYANLSWLITRLRPNEWVGDNALWIALYNGDPGNTQGYTHPRLALHQHTSQGNVNGFGGYVDRNVTLGGWSLAALLLDGTSAPAPQPPAPAPQPDGWEDYIVRPGDTLSGIAAARGTTWQELQRVNGIPNANLIFAGQRIRVPSGGGGGGGRERYQIQPGDTLSALAQRWGTTVAAIASLNGISNPNFIRAGDWLTRP